MLADPPWRFKVWSERGHGRSPERYYPTLTLKDIRAFPVAGLLKPDAFLFLWITGPFLTIGAHLDVMTAWGFKPSGIGFVWAKRTESDLGWHFGLGYNTRHNAEICLIGRRGSPVRLSRSVAELVVAPVSAHSRKPVEVHRRIEEFCAGPRLELFARARPSTAGAKSWTCFGNQLDKFTPDGIA